MKYFTWGDIRVAILVKEKLGEKLTDVESSVLMLMDKHKASVEEQHRAKKAADLFRRTSYREGARKALS